MKLKLSQILGFENFYIKVKDTTKLSIKTKFQLNKLYLESQPHNVFYQNEINALLRECAQTNEKGEYIQSEQGVALKPEKLDIFSDRISELENTEITISDFSFRLDEFDSVSADITPTDLMVLMPFITE